MCTMFTMMVMCAAGSAPGWRDKLSIFARLPGGELACWIPNAIAHLTLIQLHVTI